MDQEMSNASNDDSQINSGTSNRANRAQLNQSMSADNQIPNFKIPERKEILCDEPANDNQFYVHDKLNVKVFSEEQIINEIEKCGSQLCSNGSKCLAILNNDYFDVLYSMIYHLEEQTKKARKESIQCLQIGLKNLKEYIDKRKMDKFAEENFLTTNMVQNQETMMKGEFKIILLIQNALKAYVYLITWFMSDYSKLKEHREVQASKKQGRKPKHGDAGDIELHAIVTSQKECLKLFLVILDSNIHKFWPEHKIEEQFVELFIRSSFDMLQNASNIKNAEIKSFLFEILQKCMEKYGSELKYMLNQNTAKIISLLFNHDNLAKPLAEFVGLVAEKQNNQLANEIIKDLTQEIFHSDQQTETIGIKNVAKFVSKLSKQAPKALYLNIGLLLGFFDCESYLLRRALIKILSNIIQKVLIKDDQTDENTARIYLMTKMKFLELLMKRFLDKSSYCRVKVMKVFVKLTEENMIPRHMYLELFSNVIGRFKDQTVLVRKGSLKLFHQMIIIFGLIFNVNIKDGERFLQRNQIQEELKTAEKELEIAKASYDAINKKVELSRQQKQEQYDCIQEELQAYLDQDEEYQALLKSQNEASDIYTKADYIQKTYVDYELFLTGIHDGLHLLIMMLSSKSQQDTIEAIKVFKLLFQYGINESIFGIKKMLTLVFNKEKSIQDQVVETYEQLYFDRSFNPQVKCKNLLKLMRDSTLTEITCIEELILKFNERETLEKEVFNQLFNYYNRTHQLTAGGNEEDKKRQLYEFRLDQRCAIQLIRMIGQSQPKAIINNQKTLVDQSLKFAQMEKPDFILMKEALMIIEKILVDKQKQEENQEEGLTGDYKEYLLEMMKVIIKKFGTQDLEWFCAAETVLNFMFKVKSRHSHEYAKFIIESLVKKLYASQNEEVEMNDEGENNEQPRIQSLEGLPLKSNLTELHYAQLFFIVGHSAIKMLTFIEQMENDLKKAVSDSLQNKKGNNQEEGKEKDDDDLALITGGKDAEIEQYTQMLNNITEHKLINEKEGVLGKFLKPILNVVKAAKQKYSVRGNSAKMAQSQSPEICILERSAVLALCKFMCVSSVICNENLGLIFEILDSRIDYGVKANIIISLGDLFNRFPNELNANSKLIFKLLHDRQNHVRRQALMVITHLVLNDMLKLKGEIVDICMLLEDQDERIKDQVKLFLYELHFKGQHIIYNLFPNAISRLSQEFPDLKEDEFRNISNNLLNYINKDKQMEQIVEKLCQKLKHNVSAHDQIEWRNTAYCLTQIKYNDKIFQKLLDNYDCWKERIIDSTEVHSKFNDILEDVKKKNTISKEKIAEFEIRVNTDENTQHLIKPKQGQNTASKTRVKAVQDEKNKDASAAKENLAYIQHISQSNNQRRPQAGSGSPAQIEEEGKEVAAPQPPINPPKKQLFVGAAAKSSSKKRTVQEFRRSDRRSGAGQQQQPPPQSNPKQDESGINRPRRNRRAPQRFDESDEEMAEYEDLADIE